jgi:hypothetical protein
MIDKADEDLSLDAGELRKLAARYLMVRTQATRSPRRSTPI